jgi:hypothetical protein
MVINDVLLKHKTFLKEQALPITEYAAASTKHFKELMQCFLSKEYRLAQRAAWCVGNAVKQQPQLIQPYIKELVDQLERKDVHAAVIRNSVRILQDVTIPEELHGHVMNACFAFIESNEIPVAIKAFSLTTLFNLSKIYPDIQPELKLIIEERLPHETAAFKSRAKKILKQLA